MQLETLLAKLELNGNIYLFLSVMTTL